MSTSTIKSTQSLSYRVAVLLMIGSALAWGSGTVMSKYSLSYVPPFTLLVVQLFASVAVLWTATLIFRMQPVIRWQNIRHGWTGILEPGLAYILGLIGLSITTASTASFIGATESFLVMLFAWLILRERITRRKLLLVMLALTGVLLISATAGEDGGSHSLIGDVLILMGTASAALYVVFSSRSVTHIEPLPLCALQQSFGLLLALCVLPIGLMMGEASQLAAVPTSAWVWAALNGIVQYCVAFLMYLTALKGMPASQAAMYLTLIPIFGLTGSVIFLGEQMTVVQLAGGGLILLALMGLNLRRQSGKR